MCINSTTSLLVALAFVVVRDEVLLQYLARHNATNVPSVSWCMYKPNKSEFNNHKTTYWTVGFVTATAIVQVTCECVLQVSQSNNKRRNATSV